MKAVAVLPKRILLYCKPIDLRMGPIGLLGVVRQETQSSVCLDTVYLFCNRSHSLIKGLFWDRTGYIVFSKRLESRSFHIPVGKDVVSLNGKSLRMLLDGLKLFL